MKVYSNNQLPIYQLIGNIVRVHWGETLITKDGVDQFCYEELIVPKTYTPQEAEAIGVPNEIAINFLPENFVEAFIYE